MKRFNDLTNEELLELELEQIEALVDLECAFDGVPLMPISPIRPDEVVVEPDQIVYSAAGQDFKFKEDAQEVVNLINTKPRMETYYLGGNWSGPQGVKRTENPDVFSETRYWSDAYYDKHRVALTVYREALATYETDRKAYEAIRNQRQEVSERVSEAINKACNDRHDRDNVNVEYQRYVRIAEGNGEMALKFFLSATTYDEGFVREVLGFELAVACDMPAETCEEGEL